MQRLVQISKLFSDTNRLKIFMLILREDNLCVCEISDTLALSQPLVSRHLKLMKEAQVLEAKKEGKWMLYRIIKEAHPLLECYIKEAQKAFETLPPLKGCALVTKAK